MQENIQRYEEDEIDLILAGGIHVYSLSGTNPMFDSNGDRIYWVNRNRINSLIVTPESIKAFLQEFNLFDSNSSGVPDLVLL